MRSIIILCMAISMPEYAMNIKSSMQKNIETHAVNLAFEETSRKLRKIDLAKSSLSTIARAILADKQERSVQIFLPDQEAPIPYFARDKECDNQLLKLLAIGFCANTKNHYGRTGLHEAVMANCFKNVRILLHYGADCQETDAHGDTPLATAIKNISLTMSYEYEQTNFDIMLSLIDRGASVNTLQADGKTMLHLLAQIFCPFDPPPLWKPTIIKRIQLLIDRGISVTHREPINNHTAQELARAVGREDLAHFIASEHEKRIQRKAHVLTQELCELENTHFKRLPKEIVHMTALFHCTQDDR